VQPGNQHNLLFAAYEAEIIAFSAIKTALTPSKTGIFGLLKTSKIYYKLLDKKNKIRDNVGLNK
jgi:hypothetical protein